MTMTFLANNDMINKNKDFLLSVRKPAYNYHFDSQYSHTAKKQIQTGPDRLFKHIDCEFLQSTIYTG